MSHEVHIKNRKANFEYEVIDKYTSGVILLGSEIKSIRNNQANISNAYCLFIKQELFIRDLHISEYTNSHTSHKPKRERKLLLNRRELNKIFSKVRERGMSVIPLSLYINTKGIAKLEIALAKGKKIHDKRETIRKKDQERDQERDQSTRK